MHHFPTSFPVPDSAIRGFYHTATQQDQSSQLDAYNTQDAGTYFPTIQTQFPRIKVEPLLQPSWYPSPNSMPCLSPPALPFSYDGGDLDMVPSAEGSVDVYQQYLDQRMQGNESVKQQHAQLEARSHINYSAMYGDDTSFFPDLEILRIPTTATISPALLPAQPANTNVSDYDFSALHSLALSDYQNVAATYSPMPTPTTIFAPLSDLLFPQITNCDFAVPKYETNMSFQITPTTPASTPALFDQDQPAQPTLSRSPRRRKQTITSSVSPPKPKRKLKTPPPRESCSYPGCTKTFTRQFNLVAHMRTHDPNRPRPYVCGICGADFVRSHDLTRHRSVHTKAKPYGCPICETRFTRADALRRHEKLGKCAGKEEEE